jgi:hypothetical protein
MEEQETTPLPAKPKKEKSNLKQISFWAGLFRNFFTIIASLVSVVTLFILIRQNENTYRPDIEVAVETPVFEILYADTPSTCRDIRLQISGDSILSALALQLVNLGMGAAKDITLHWQAAPEKMRDTVRLGADAVVTGIRYEPSLGMVVFGNCMNQPYQTEHLPFVLPVNQSDRPSTVRLPDHIAQAWCNLLVRSLLPGDDIGRCSERIRVFCREFRYIGLEASYSDINSKRHVRRFRLSLLPRYIDMDGRKIICGLSLSDEKRNAPENEPTTVSVLFPGHIFKKVEIR